MNQYSCAPVFFYAYRPFANKQSENDGGFSVTLFENGSLVYCRFAEGSVCIDQKAFFFRQELNNAYRDLLLRSAGWLTTVPPIMRLPGEHRSASCFAYDGVEPIHVWDLDDLVLQPFASPAGLYARRLHMLFEEVSILLSAYGIFLKADSFWWDPAVLVPADQQSGRQGEMPYGFDALAN